MHLLHGQAELLPPGMQEQMAVAAHEHRGILMAEALIAACAIVSHADGRSSLIERWRLGTVLADDRLLAMLPPDTIAAAVAEHRRAFLANPTAARQAALRQVARLLPEPHKARMVFDACLLVTGADEQLHPAEVAAMGDIRAALAI